MVQEKQVPPGKTWTMKSFLLMEAGNAPSREKGP